MIIINIIVIQQLISKLIIPRTVFTAIQHGKLTVGIFIFLNKTACHHIGGIIVQIGNAAYLLFAVRHIDDKGILAVVVKISGYNINIFVGIITVDLQISVTVKRPVHFADNL